MTAERYKYYAFISYSRKDGRMARWLQRRLEWFRFPVKLVPEEQRPGHPKYVRPVYLDKTSLDVTRAHYWESIHQSRYEAAREAYARYAGDAVFADGPTWKQAIAEDFARLRAAGRDHPDMKKIEGMMERGE